MPGPTFAQSAQPVPAMSMRSLTLGATLSGLSMIGLGGISMLCHEPLLIPAVGASAYVVFFAPRAPFAAPRNVVLGHLFGALIGWSMLALFGLLDAPGGFAVDPVWPRVFAVAASLGLTTFVLGVLRALHPPAGATTMIVATGLMPQLQHVVCFTAAAAFVALLAWIAWRRLGVEYPVWRHRG